MNRKNLTAAVLAGLAGVAGIAGTAQAVNLNPDGLGQVLIYPYYTTNDGNQTILSVVNTTDNAKAVKVRFMEGFNSREVLDFNLYLSKFDVWVAAISDGDEIGLPVVGLPGAVYLSIPDSSCTVPYLYGTGVDDGLGMGLQQFLDLAYTGTFEDGGPTSLLRAGEGHFEMIEMGTITDASKIPPDPDATPPITGTLGTAEAVTHVTGADGIRVPANCQQLVDNWTENFGKDSGIWFQEAKADCSLDPKVEDGPDCGQAHTDTTRNSGGLFGGAAVVNNGNGTMYSYDAKAIQGFDKTADGLHFIPGTIFPSLNSGSESDAWVFFGAPQNAAVQLEYPRSVDAVSAVFMHEKIMNEFTTDDDLAASTEWVITFPTKNFYVDELRIPEVTNGVWIPDASDPQCNGWKPGEPFPPQSSAGPHLVPPGWAGCTYVFLPDALNATRPFTSLFQGGRDVGKACERTGLITWDREEDTFLADDPGGSRPPVVSPSPPLPCDPALQNCTFTTFELCYEVNVLRVSSPLSFGGQIFGTPEIDGASLLVEVTDQNFENGWAVLSFDEAKDSETGATLHKDFAGLLGLPVTGFAAYEFENEFLGPDADIKAFYGGLFGHKANVRRSSPPICDAGGCGSINP
jgi:hypothetical protein